MASPAGYGVMRDVWLSLLLMAVFQACGGAVCADVRLMEVMYAPAGSELTDEFIEVQNIGPLPVDMTGWRVGEGAVTEALIAVGSASLASGQFGLLLDPDYELGVGAYAPLPGDAILLLLDDGTFGRSGLSNTQAETIVLLNAQGDTIDTHTYSIGNDEGFTEERTRGIEDLWSATLWRGRTPGSINSISPKEMDLEVTADVTLVPYSHEPLVALTLHNRGRQAAGGDLILSLEGAEVDRVRIPEIALGSADSITAVGAAYPGRTLFYEARGISPGDQDATNDRVSVRVVYGVIPGGVVLSELMVAPSAGPEWIEVVNRSGVEVDLFGWGFWDSSGKRGHVRTPSLLQDGARAVLSKGEVNEVEAVQVEPWPVLNDGGTRSPCSTGRVPRPIGESTSPRDLDGFWSGSIFRPPVMGPTGCLRPHHSGRRQAGPMQWHSLRIEACT